MTLGFFIYDSAEILDIIVELLISLLLFLFFRTLNYLLTMEAFIICHSESFDHEKRSQDIVTLYREIKATPLERLRDKDVTSKGVCFILLLIERFKPFRFLSCCLNDTCLQTKEEAQKFMTKYFRILVVYVIVIPLCFLANSVLEKRHDTERLPKVIINLIKGITTGYCMSNLIFYVKNLEDIMKEYGLLVKFFCVKLIIFFVIVQTMVLSFISIDTSYHTQTEMGHIINFFLLCMENCLLSAIWVSSFGVGGLMVNKFKETKNAFIANQNKNNKSELMSLPKAEENSKSVMSSNSPYKNHSTKKENEKL